VTLASKARAPGKYLTGLQWFLAKSGPAASNHFEAGGFIRSRAGIEHPDLQFTFMPLAVMPGTVETRAEHSFQVHIDLLRPESLGTVEARSTDPRQPPAIRFNYLQSPRDREDFRVSVALLREILAQKALDPYRGEELFPGPGVRSAAEVDAWVRQALETCYHPVGTCKMGTASDQTAVVDDTLRVHGLDGLRVVDASIMPSIVSGNTNAPTIMIAERAADLIRGKQPLPPVEAPVWIHPNWDTAQR
jgi:choline dehydrogenase